MEEMKLKVLRCWFAEWARIAGVDLVQNGENRPGQLLTRAFGVKVPASAWGIVLVEASIGIGDDEIRSNSLPKLKELAQGRWLMMMNVIWCRLYTDRAEKTGYIPPKGEDDEPGKTSGSGGEGGF